MFLTFWGDSGNKVSPHFHTNSEEMISYKKNWKISNGPAVREKNLNLINGETNKNRNRDLKFDKINAN